MLLIKIANRPYSALSIANHIAIFGTIIDTVSFVIEIKSYN